MPKIVAEKDKRKIQIHFLVTIQEKKTINALAKAVGLTPADYMRLTSLQKIKVSSDTISTVK